MLHILLLFAVFGTTWKAVDGQLRLCEAEGSCRHCADSRYSYYRCRMQDDCFIGEVCDNGFCCPNTLPTFSLQREPTSPKPKTTNSTFDPPADEPCPDDSRWSRRCSRDEDCTHQEELCIEGKCCKSECTFI
ncbi:hypothetical protein GCK72_018635 [Caenorhabditis remanei]|uniref:WAP domain-containing protein n=1 Tax=Caenorhabditis remanei TaxID=31234 RepID=A0A6A5GBI4_CAERE|nr:hypothetical protein GCK72_018635 [Caenorhabditis remanei]KAF1752081.1 hypothetical protein GCK72_018635 [Caenorhabditis remanei]